jgi:hypothetical protein
MRSPVASSGTVTMRFMADVRALGAPFSVMTGPPSGRSVVAWCHRRASSASTARTVVPRISQYGVSTGARLTAGATPARPG